MTYAWDKLEEAETLNLNLDSYQDAVNLFGRVLVSGCNHIIKRGLDRSYLSTEQDYSGVKGKLNVYESFSRQLFNHGKTNCSFDEFTTNVLHNRVLKSTLRVLANLSIVDRKIRDEAWQCFHRFRGVDEIEPNLRLFSLIHLHRNNSYYGLPLNVAKFLLENIVLDETEGQMKFKNFVRDEKAMAALFEDFIRNFYAREQNYYKVRREDIKWQVEPLFGSDYSLLPKMQTDITLESASHKLIIDTKYYSKTTGEYYGSEKLHSTNLYQLHAYLTNIEKDISNARNSDCDGMLLYPKISKDYDETNRVGNHTIRVKTIDLSKEWREIETELLYSVNFYSKHSLSNLAT